ncbi:MAG: o-succinylbenzoate synthase [Firmicutes bacterium]|nr:o-succinylbenzoate synthase [Bacillota bacterium]
MREVTVRRLALPLVAPIVTSYGQQQSKVCLLVQVDLDGQIGHGECAALAMPFYTEETVDTAWHVLVDFAVPRLIGATFDHPSEVWEVLSVIRGNHMAKAALEMAVWDAYGRSCSRSLADCLGGVLSEVPLGVTCGTAASPDALLESVGAAVAQGYRRVKLKIAPSWDVVPTAAVRAAYPDLTLAVDANAAYGSGDFQVFKKLDKMGLSFIEQPFAARDLPLHAQLQSEVQTPLCLDESICHEQDVEIVARLQAARAINIKPARVGGVEASLRVLASCRRHGLATWCGGMYETSFGRAASIAVAACDEAGWASELAPAERHLAVDIVRKPAKLASPGRVAVPVAPGVGVELDGEVVSRYSVRVWSASAGGHRM